MTNRVYRPYTHPFIHSEVKQTPAASSKQSKSFVDQLQAALTTQDNQLTLSKHAKQRLEQRGIEINEAQWNRIGQKVKEAKRSGVVDSLVLLNDAALIVSAKNQTVITAMDRSEANAQIFTNINGTILMDY